MDDLVQKVASAMCESTHGPWSIMPDDGREVFMIEARAAIAAVYDDLEATYNASLTLAGPCPHDVVSLLAAKRREVLGDEPEAPVPFDWNHDGHADG